MDANQFLKNLHEHGDGNGVIELRVKSEEGPIVDRRFTANPGVIDTVVKSQQKKSDRNAVYFGVGRRRKGSRQGRKEDVYSVPGLWADVDTKKMGWDTVKTTRFLHSLPFPFRPSVCVHSGGGLHLYWMLSKPIVFGEYGTERWHKRVADFERVNKKFQQVFTSDMVFDISRVLRLPGTLNTKAVLVKLDDGTEKYSSAGKYSTKVECIWSKWWQTCDLAEYEEAIDDYGQWDKDGVSQRVLGDGFWTTPKMLERDDEGDSADYDAALAVAVRQDKGGSAAGWSEIWSRCRYHANRFPYIGIDVASMRATAFVWCRKENDLDPERLVDRVMDKIEEIKDRDAPNEAWDMVKERAKVLKQLNGWIKKWTPIKAALETEAKKERAARRKAAKEKEAKT